MVLKNIVLKISFFRVADNYYSLTCHQGIVLFIFLFQGKLLGMCVCLLTGYRAVYRRPDQTV